MKSLSINIPTYNRDKYLKKNLLIIISQLRDDNLLQEVEINISDNASTDNTPTLVKQLIQDNKDISINYKRNRNNLGPDLNFINTMKMATGKYSILFGDDDYFEPKAIKKLLQMFKENEKVTFFLYNRISIDNTSNHLYSKPFLRPDVETEIFNFQFKNDVIAYFAQVTDHGGILTFISSVAYKTSILSEVGEYDERCTGSCYSFLFYWWNSLMKGKQLMYVNEYLVKATVDGATNNNYGQGLKRLLVDTEGLSRIANIVFEGKNISYKNSFLEAVRRPISNSRIYSSLMNDTEKLSIRFFDSMSSCGWDESTIYNWRYILSQRNIVKMLLKSILPHCLAVKIKF